MKKAAALVFMLLLVLITAACSPGETHLEYPESDAVYNAELTVKSNGSRYKVKIELTGQGSVKTLSFTEPEELTSLVYVKDADGIRARTGELTLPSVREGSAAHVFALFELADGDISGVSSEKIDGVKHVIFGFADGSTASLRASDGRPARLENEYVLLTVTD